MSCPNQPRARLSEAAAISTLPFTLPSGASVPENVALTGPDLKSTDAAIGAPDKMSVRASEVANPTGSPFHLAVPETATGALMSVICALRSSASTRLAPEPATSASCGTSIMPSLTVTEPLALTESRIAPASSPMKA